MFLKKNDKEQTVLFEINKSDFEKAGLNKLVLQFKPSSKEQLEKYGIRLNNEFQTVTIENVLPPRKRISIGFKSTSTTIVYSGSTGNLAHEMIVAVKGELPTDVEYEIVCSANNTFSNLFKGSHVISKSEKQQSIKFQIDEYGLKKSGLKNFNLILKLSSKKYFDKYGIELRDAVQNVTIKYNPPPPKDVLIGFKSTSVKIVNDGSSGNHIHEIAVVANDKLPMNLRYRIEPTVNNTFVKKAFSGVQVIKKNEIEQMLKFSINKRQLEASRLKKIGLKIIPASEY